MKFKDLLKIISVPAAVFIVHIILTYGFNIYDHWNWFDSPMHFVGGMSIAVSVYLYLSFKRSTGHLKDLTGEDQAFTIIAATSLAAVGWEILEFLADLYIYQGPHFQPNNFNTMKDLILGVFGAIVVVSLIYKKLWRAQNSTN